MAILSFKSTHYFQRDKLQLSSSLTLVLQFMHEKSLETH